MKTATYPDLHALPMLPHETLSVGIDSGQQTHVAGCVSETLLQRHQRFERCPALSFRHTREGFRPLVDRMCSSVPLTQVSVVMDVTGHSHLPLVHSLQEIDIPASLMPTQKRQEGRLTSDTRDALGLGNILFNHLERGIHVGDPLQAIRQLVPPTEAATQVRGIVQHRRELGTERTQRKNTLTSICDEIFPELTQLDFVHVQRTNSRPKITAPESSVGRTPRQDQSGMWETSLGPTTVV